MTASLSCSSISILASMISLFFTTEYTEHTEARPNHLLQTRKSPSHQNGVRIIGQMIRRGVRDEGLEQPRDVVAPGRQGAHGLLHAVHFELLLDRLAGFVGGGAELLD